MRSGSTSLLRHESTLSPSPMMAIALFHTRPSARHPPSRRSADAHSFISAAHTTSDLDYLPSVWGVCAETDSDPRPRKGPRRLDAWEPLSTARLVAT